MANILVVDDRPLNREFLAMLLKYKNHNLFEAEDGVKALEIAKTKYLDLIITDILMPTMDGYELVRQLRQDPKLADIPVIFYTATYRSEEARLLGASCGVRFVLSKPSEPQIIIDTVQEALNIVEESPTPTSENPGSTLSSFLTEPTELTQINQRLLKNLAKIEGVKKQFSSFVESKEFAKGHDSLINNISALTDNLIQLRKITSQLIAVTELNSSLVEESDPKKLLPMFCRGTRNVLGSKYGVLGILDDKSLNLEYFHISGMDDVTKSTIGIPTLVNKGIINRLLKKRDVIKINNTEKLSSLELLPNHPPISNFLGFPIISKTHVYGFAYFADKMDGTEFSDEDRKITQTLVSTLTNLFENINLYDSLQRHAARLQIEITERRKIEEKLYKSELMFREFAENIQEVFWRTSPNMDEVIYVSPSFEEIWGYSLESCYANPQRWYEAIVPEDQPRVKKKFDDLMQSKVENVNLEFKITRSDGEIRQIYTRAFPLKDKQGQLLSLLGVSSDITEYQQNKDRLRILNDITSILKKSGDMREIFPKITQFICKALHWDVGVIWMLDPVKKVLRSIDIVNQSNISFAILQENIQKRSFKKGIGLPGVVWQKKKPYWIQNLSQDESFIRKPLAKEAELQSGFAVPILHRNTVYGVVELFSLNLRELDPAILEMVQTICIQMGDFIHNKFTEEQLIHISCHDILTGLLTRTSFEEEVDKKLKNISTTFVGIIILDINRFKLINESLGHEAGDTLLKFVADKIHKAAAQIGGICAHFGSDKFTLALFHAQSVEQIIDYIHEIQKIMKDSFFIKDQDIFITPNMGISIYPQDGLETKTLLQNAEIALNQSKVQEGAHFQFFTTDFQSLISEKFVLEKELRVALLKKQFCLYYQPILDIKTEKIYGFEALIRWQHPTRGLLTPFFFLPIAEETELIILIGEWVLREVFSHLKNKELSINGNFSIAVNLSMHQLSERYDLIGFIKKLVNEFGDMLKFIEFEVTENIFSKDTKYCLKLLNSIKKMGASLALDDFGTGYCSLRYLQNFSVDRIKIDKSFIDGIPNNQRNIAISKSIITLAHNLGIKVIAEGVEKKEQLDFLVKEKCDEIQGYYFFRPLPVSEIKRLIHVEF